MATSLESFQVPAHEVLGEFRARLQQVVRPEDVQTHYDLGIAYKEMGLLDEAVAEFEVALRHGGGTRAADCLHHARRLRAGARQRRSGGRALPAGPRAARSRGGGAACAAVRARAARSRRRAGRGRARAVPGAGRRGSRATATSEPALQRLGGTAGAKGRPIVKPSADAAPRRPAQGRRADQLRRPPRRRLRHPAAEPRRSRRRTAESASCDELSRLLRAGAGAVLERARLALLLQFAAALARRWCGSRISARR